MNLPRSPQPDFKLEVVRVAPESTATLGVLLVCGVPRFTTLELPWRGNQADVSDIPPGNYTARVYLSPKNGRCLAITGVPDRGNIELHAGNIPTQTLGCILIGMEFGGDGASVAMSRAALVTLLAICNDKAPPTFPFIVRQA